MTFNVQSGLKGLPDSSDHMFHSEDFNLITEDTLTTINPNVLTPNNHIEYKHSIYLIAS